MRHTRLLTLPALGWLMLSGAACSTVIGIDGDYTDATSGAGASSQSGASSEGGASARGGATSEGGSSSAGGTLAQAGVSNCGGLSSNGLCWYLGNVYDSCTEACSNHGGAADGAASFIGTAAQGGSLDKCAALLSALGQPAPTQFARTDDRGIGCTRYGTKTYWTSAPDYNPASKLLNARLVCGCQR